MSPRWYGKQIPLSTPIHRYMALRWFRALAVDRTLGLTRLDVYHDESSDRRDPDEARHSAPMWAYFRKMTAGTVNERDALAHMKRIEEKLARSVAVSCWTLAERESSRAWREWGSAPGSVRVSTTIGMLLNVVAREPELAVGRVNYINRARDWIRLDEDTVRIAFAKGAERWAWQDEFRLALAPGPLLEGPPLAHPFTSRPIQPGPWLSEVRLQPGIDRASRQAIEQVLSELASPPPTVLPSDLTSAH